MIARTVRLDADVDLLAVAGPDGFLFEEHGAGLAGRGIAARLRLSDAPEALAAIQTEDEVGLPGCGAVAFGALPFFETADDEVIVPELVVGRTADGARWITTIGPVGTPTPPIECVAPVPRVGWAADVQVTSSRPAADWKRAVATARDRIRAGGLDKVVLARELVVDMSEPIDLVGVIARLRSSFPSSFVYSVNGIVGASPELLVSRAGDVVRSHPLAGTAPRSGDPAVDARIANALVASTKDQLEHRLTIAMVHDTLLPWCSYLDEEAEPSIVAVANVQHLGTLVEGRLSKPLPSVVELVRALHPTPAVGGHPREVALATIDELEKLDRGRYAGPVGWVDAAGNGRWAVALRCARDRGETSSALRGRRCRTRLGRGRGARGDAGQVRRDAGRAAPPLSEQIEGGQVDRALHRDRVDRDPVWHRQDGPLDLREAERPVQGNARERGHQVEPSEALRARRIAPCFEDPPPEPSARPVRAHEHRPDVRRFARWVEQAAVVGLVTRSRVEPSATAPSSARNDLVVDFVHEVGAVTDKCRIDVCDVDRRAGDLLLVIEAAEEIEHR